MPISMVPVPLRSVLCQHHGDCGDVRRCHSHRPSVSPSQPQQRTDATIGKSRTCKRFTFSGSLLQQLHTGRCPASINVLQFLTLLFYVKIPIQREEDTKSQDCLEFVCDQNAETGR